MGGEQRTKIAEKAERDYVQEMRPCDPLTRLGMQGVGEKRKLQWDARAEMERLGDVARFFLHSDRGKQK